MESSSSNSLNWKTIRTEVLASLVVLLNFAKNPIQGMKNLPEWTWPRLLILMGGFAALCGVLTGIVNRSFLGIISGLFVYPISTLLMLAILSGLFYYVFYFFFKFVELNSEVVGHIRHRQLEAFCSGASAGLTDFY